MEAILAQPRGFCAGVVRAIEIVELALDVHGPPVYVLHEIVHNQRVLSDLEGRGAVFVEDLDLVPQGSVLIFSAHGVARNRYREAQARGLRVIDATCPLVTKVHLEAARHARASREVVLIGHAGHAEVNGTLGQYNRQWNGDIYLVQNESQAEALVVRNPENLAYVTQTTLSVDDTARIIAVLKRRFPAIQGPRKDDICYATQNRQSAIREMAGELDQLIVVGARNSSNSNRLREVGEHSGCPSYLVQDAGELSPRWFRPGMRVGISAGASTPEILVQEILNCLRGFGLERIVERKAEPEGVTFPLPNVLAAGPVEIST